MGVASAFWPSSNDGVQSGTISVTATSQRIQLNGNGVHVYVANVGANEAFICFGGSSVVAAAAGSATQQNDGVGMSIPPGFVGTINRGQNTHVAAICASGLTSLIRFTTGDGQ